MKEWKIIKEAPNYEVSNYGDVRNLKTKKELAGSSDKNGYKRVMLSCGHGKKITRFRHRLASIAFLPNPQNYPVVNHKDENKTNNFVGTKENNYEDGNLEWCSQEYNMNYGTCRQRRIETMKRTQSLRHGITTYVYDYVTHQYLGKYPSIQQAAVATDCDYRAVHRVVHGERPHTKKLIFSPQELSFDND